MTSLEMWEANQASKIAKWSLPNDEKVKRRGENLDGTVGLKTAESFKQSTVDVMRCLGHIWTPDVHWSLYAQPPVVDGQPQVCKEYQVDETNLDLLIINPMCFLKTMA